jgi:hypothetical protein
VGHYIFEINSKLTRIDQYSCYDSIITALLFSVSIQFISGSTFQDLSLDSVCFVGSANSFYVEDCTIIDISGRSMICNFDCSTIVMIDSAIEVIMESCFVDVNILNLLF